MKSPALFGITVQLGITLPLCLIMLVYGLVPAYSFGLGALLFIVPNTYFTLYAFRYSGARFAQWTAKSFSWGESGKFALVAVGFALAFRFVTPLHVPLLFVGFCTMVALQWWIAYYVQKHWRKR
ncbi:ATP synthase subunit I [Teredinibacter purpureus]|jgi:F0F1-type ATP synthase, subunit I|uniref:ATP synthase subunit I n=1 Tax=Teredinibacter purpureus TaxID=2731756 RepID=UPI0005F77956|nr:ATP synthase subunit I [Teredinibacter purpureus]